MGKIQIETFDQGIRANNEEEKQEQILGQKLQEISVDDQGDDDGEPDNHEIIGLPFFDLEECIDGLENQTSFKTNLEEKRVKLSQQEVHKLLLGQLILKIGTEEKAQVFTATAQMVHQISATRVMLLTCQHVLKQYDENSDLLPIIEA